MVTYVCVGGPFDHRLYTPTNPRNNSFKAQVVPRMVEYNPDPRTFVHVVYVKRTVEVGNGEMISFFTPPQLELADALNKLLEYYGRSKHG